MQEWFLIVFLILVGLLLIYLELIFISGTTIFGIAGLVLTGAGIYLTYDQHGDTSGNWVLAGSALITVVAVIMSFRSKSWEKFSLKGTNKSKVNEGYFSSLELEMIGQAVSDLKPIGKAEFNEKVYEVTSAGHLIESGSTVKITRILGNKIIVEIFKN